jgi:uncharacterized protein
MPRTRAAHASASRRTTSAAQTRAAKRTPVIEVLDRAGCEAMLARHHVGRLAFSFHDRVDIEPIHYLFEDGWIYGRTSAGSKVATIEHSRWVAFEVDEVRGIFTWKSVVAHGAFYVLAPSGTDVDHRAWTHARAAIRRLLPDAWTPDDPVPFRTVLFRIHIAELTGRVARDRAQPESET